MGMVKAASSQMGTPDWFYCSSEQKRGKETMKEAGADLSDWPTGWPQLHTGN